MDTEKDVKPGEIKYNKKNILNWVEVIIFALFFVLILFVFIIQKSEVKGSSMEPTLFNEDKLIIYKSIYAPKHKDIVVIVDEKKLDEPIVKRIIGIPGDIIDINYEEGILYRNNKVILEPYIKEIMEPPFVGLNEKLTDLPVTLLENEYFVLGDNRNKSLDSKYESIGIINRKAIFGKVAFRFWTKKLLKNNKKFTFNKMPGR